MNILRIVRSWFAWEDVFTAGANLYQQNRITGKRRYIKIAAVHSPLDRVWLDGGEQGTRIARPPAPSPITSALNRKRSPLRG